MCSSSDTHVFCSGTAAVFLTGLLLISSLSTAARAQDTEQDQNEFDKVIEVGVKPGQMRYDVEEFSVPAGGRIKLVFDNSNGTLQHNLLILVPGDEDSAVQLAQEAWSMQNPFQNDYVPDSEKVLFHTALLSPGETETITFKAPDTPGDHPYVCTMPGHAQTMNGIMHVKEAETSSGGQNGSDSTGESPEEFSVANLSYQYYEGSWKKLPNFDDLDPDGSGQLQEGKVTLDPAGRSNNYGLLFQGKLQVPKKGTYQFFLASDDGSRLVLNGKRLINNDGVHPKSTQSNKAELPAGTYDLRVEYFQRAGQVALQFAAVTPDENVVHLSEQQGNFANQLKFSIKDVSTPKVFRVRLPDAPSRSIAVGLPSGVHYCFDPNGGFLRYAWAGNFLNVGPERGNGTGRGGKVCKILGDRFALGSSEQQPLRIGNPDASHTVEFRGYIRNEEHPPKMMYDLDGRSVRQQVSAAGEGRGIHITYSFETAPGSPVYYRVNRDAVEVSAPQGEWMNDSTIKFPGTEQLEITIRNPQDE